MSERILTLFGEEVVVPEPVKAVGKSRAKKAKEAAEGAVTGEFAEVEVPPVVNEVETVAEVAPINEIVEVIEVAPVPAVETNEVEGLPEVVEEIEEEPVVAETPVKEAKEKEPKEQKEPKALTNLPIDWEGDKQYYSIGEVAALFSVRTSHIRFWTNEFKLNVRTTRKGDRLYTPEQIKEIRAIHHLVKERGFTLTGAKAKLKAQNKMDVETVDLKQSLQKLRNKLIIIKNQLVA